MALPVASGVPQGSIIGPIIFILFTSDLPAHLTHGGLTSYADDTLHVDCAIPDGRGLAELRSRLELTLRELHAWFSSNSLKMNGSKTDFMIVGSKQNLKEVQNLSFIVDDASTQPSKTIKILGVVDDPLLSWEAHISHVVQKCNKIIFSLYKFRHYFTSDALKILVQAYVFPHIVYCVCVWGGAAKGQMHKIQKLINFSARIVTVFKKNQHITPALNSLHWPGPILQRCGRPHFWSGDVRRPHFSGPMGTEVGGACLQVAPPAGGLQQHQPEWDRVVTKAPWRCEP